MQYQNMLAIEKLRDVFLHILVYAVAGWIALSGQHVPKGQASVSGTSPIAGPWEKKGYKGVMNKESLDSIPSCMFLAEAGSPTPAEKVN